MGVFWSVLRPNFLLETVATYLDLGVLVDMKQSFIDYISMVLGKAWTVLGFMNRKGQGNSLIII